jgi:hypothetical protein
MDSSQRRGSVNEGCPCRVEAAQEANMISERVNRSKIFTGAREHLHLDDSATKYMRGLCPVMGLSRGIRGSSLVLWVVFQMGYPACISLNVTRTPPTTRHLSDSPHTSSCGSVFLVIEVIAYRCCGVCASAYL